MVLLVCRAFLSYKFWPHSTRWDWILPLLLSGIAQVHWCYFFLKYLTFGRVCQWNHLELHYLYFRVPKDFFFRVICFNFVAAIRQVDMLAISGLEFEPITFWVFFSSYVFYMWKFYSRNHKIIKWATHCKPSPMRFVLLPHLIHGLFSSVSAMYF